MLVKNLVLAFTLAAIGLAQDVDSNDVPNQCQAVCASVVSLTSSCDQQNDDRAELDCVCQASGADTQVPLCAACVSQYDSDGNDNDVNDIVRSCSFSTTTYNPPAASASLTMISGSASLTTPAASSAQSTDSAQSSGAITSGSGTAGGAATQTTGGAADQSTNAAPAPTMGVAGAGLGLLGFAIGML
ncbi:hypothetical protein BU26DRAFT_276623 [Trematosphaeria pertusa]|uniref:Extracellular membrane protein CFEM domain-containing protein n=1 Tax=Trematosphaeria pertusa TaxID=390896 RepID=A0A6A6INS1_9PLEO|nr:uncharacterized protein BU26DRAFT_276623 [Trematosphaeria pertusa]KAF2251133.1 hypothetical protein BU26DRAFT_276623 [Trematosphaeria pertusa]